MAQARVRQQDLVKRVEAKQPTTEAEYEARNRDARLMITRRMKEIQDKALCPVHMDPDVCPCGEIECNGFCEKNVWALRVLLEAIAGEGFKEDREFTAALRDILRP